MGDFLERARELLDQGALSAGDETRFRNVLDYRNRHDVAEKQANLNLSNLEHLFGLVDVNRRLDPDVWKVHDDLIFLILKTLGATVAEKEKPIKVFFVTEQGGKYHDGRSRISDYFVDIITRRWDQPETIKNADSIISLNYDLLIEQAMARREITPDYSIVHRSGDPPNHPHEKAKVKLLKLHGSVNWAICSNANCQRAKIYPADKAIVSTTRARGMPHMPQRSKAFHCAPDVE